MAQKYLKNGKGMKVRGFLVSTFSRWLIRKLVSVGSVCGTKQWPWSQAHQQSDCNVMNESKHYIFIFLCLGTAVRQGKIMVLAKY